MKVTKEKNIVTFTVTEGKNYVFDINSLELYGIQNQALKRVPTNLKNFEADDTILNVIKDLFRRCDPSEFKKFKDCLILADKFSSLGYSKEISLSTIEEFIKILDTTIYETEITEKFLFNFVKERNAQEKEITFSALKQNLIEKKLNELALIIYDKKDKEFFKAFCSSYSYPVDFWKSIAHWINKGLGRFFGYSCYEANCYLSKFFDEAKVIGYTPTKDNFFYQAVQVNKNYEIQKEEIDHKRLLEVQTKINLNFENEEFIVIVPTTRQEFKQEGDNQGNCVYTVYLNEVLNAKTNIVFIRKKSDITKSYITCEIHNGKIKQYLASCNKEVQEKKALNFRIQYQNYLNDIFNS